MFQFETENLLPTILSLILPKTIWMYGRGCNAILKARHTIFWSFSGGFLTDWRVENCTFPSHSTLSSLAWNINFSSRPSGDRQIAAVIFSLLNSTVQTKVVGVDLRSLTRFLRIQTTFLLVWISQFWPCSQLWLVTPCKVTNTDLIGSCIRIQNIRNS